MENIALLDPPRQSMTLADGRLLTWQEFGLPDGKPVCYFHGGGGISLEAGLFHREAVQRNIRLIATNRPGAAGTTVCPGRPVAAYSNDLSELLDSLNIEKFACFGESNGGLVTLAMAATIPDRVLGAVPINPTVPWFDPLARRVSSCSVAIGYRLTKYWPGLVAALAANSADRLRRQKSAARLRRQKSAARRNGGGFNPLDLLGPPPGTEPDIAELQWRVMGQAGKQALLAEMQWASSSWGFDYYSIPVTLDFFCGAHDAQAPFALVLADSNADARFHCFSFGHYGFSHPDARHRILATICGYFES